MAEILASALSEVLIDKLISSAFQEIGRVWGVKDEFKKLHQTLTSIHAVLYDAERKQVEDMSVKNWLKQLKDVAYDIEDILGDFEYEALHRKLKIQGRFRNKVKNSFSLSNPLVFRLKMVPKIKDIHQRLNEITTEKQRFEFNVRSSTIVDTNCSKSSGHRETSSLLVDDPKIVGRESDKSKIIGVLLNSTNEKDTYSVVRVVGIGGLGKTTVAQLVYNDPRVKDHFDIKMWACVSQNSNKKVVYSNLLESNNGKKCEVSSLEAMVKSLSESLERKRYLIVLDDIWSDGSIILDDILAELLSMGVKGSSKILVTMRSDEDIPMDSIYTHRLGELPEEECWSLFEKIAFGHGRARKTPEFVKIGKKIVKKCGGVPLAAKILGGMMCSKTNEAEWLSIQNSEIWRLPEGNKKITSVLKLSYDHLPPHLKRCFSYCSIFPKGLFVDREMLIQLWMAEGFLISPLGESKSLENIGNEYFDSLLQNCFFQDERRNEWGDMESYKMHDLVHDLGLSVVGIECSFLDGCTIKEEANIEKLRHVRVLDHVFTIPQELYKAKKLRTFLGYTDTDGGKMAKTIIWDQTFLNLYYLRVLDLAGIKAIQELPPTFGKLKHLRYLELSSTGLRSLPGSFTRLYNLQTLRLQNCDDFEELPEGMNKLINLIHLIISGNKLIQMPLEIGKLSRLQSLSIFIVGRDKGYGIDELKGLNHLGGKLNICNLENVRDGIFAREADLKEKQNIRCLLLEWTDTSDTSHVINNHHAILEGLQPNKNLKCLLIGNYAAPEFPTWIMSACFLPNLVSLTLSNCYKCEYLPALGQLPLLKFLYLEKLNTVKWIGSEFYCSDEEAATRVASPSISFPCLKALSLKQMSNLEEWSEHMSSSICFPCLEELHIEECSKLTSISGLISPLISQMVTSNQGSLTRIRIQSCNELRGLPQTLLWGNGALKSLRIRNCDNFKGFIPNQESMDCSQLDPLLGDATIMKALFQVCASNSSLQSLDLFSCPVLEFLPDLRGFNYLQTLNMWYCGRLKSLPDGIKCLPALEYLRIGGLSKELVSFPFPDSSGSEGSNQYFILLRLLFIVGWSNLKSLPDQLQYLTSLQHLVIKKFCSLESLPEWLGNLTSLQYLRIRDCQNLKHLPSQEQMLRLTSLQELSITDCPLLGDICSGRELHKIAHIPKVYDFSQKPRKLVVEFGSVVG